MLCDNSQQCPLQWNGSEPDEIQLLKPNTEDYCWKVSQCWTITPACILLPTPLKAPTICTLRCWSIFHIVLICTMNGKSQGAPSFKPVNLKYSYFLTWSRIPVQHWLKISIIRTYFSVIPANFTKKKKNLNSTFCTPNILPAVKECKWSWMCGQFESEVIVLSHNHSQPHQNTTAV
jgi:hypothetical protein